MSLIGLSIDISHVLTNRSVIPRGLTSLYLSSSPSPGARALGTAAISLVHVLNPELIVLSGHLAPTYVDKVTEMINAEALRSARQVTIKVSTLKEPALLGAASIVLEYATRRTF